MTDWVRASNPTAPITNEAEATAAARASALAIFLGVLWGIVGVIQIFTSQTEMAEAAAAAAASDPAAAGMAGAMVQGVLFAGIAMVVIQAILGFVQWARPNIVIPIIFLILVAFGLVSGVFGMVMTGQEGMPQSPAAPAWQIWVGFVILIIQLLMHTAGIRGASKLDKLRFEAANR
jgi:hypothetical protein